MEKNQLIEKIVAAEKIITKSDSIIRVVSHYDPDGICSAAIIAKAFHRLGIKFHITIVRDLNDAVIESIEKEKNKLIIFCDMGSGQIEMVERLNSGVVIFDHHPPIRDTKKVMQINPYFYGINGTYEATASMLTFLLAICIDDKNWDLIGLAVCGAIGDRQHIGGFKGLNKEYLDKGIEKGYLTEKEGLGLTGLTIKEALRDSVEPCFKEFFAKEKEVENFLKKIKLDGDTAMS
ncbi:MAG: DHH family phosphoesterase, partial [Candidatus Thermoplasmatota archaeon]